VLGRFLEHLPGGHNQKTHGNWAHGHAHAPSVKTPKAATPPADSAPEPIAKGDRVETPDGSRGQVKSIAGNSALVVGDDGFGEWHPLADLNPVGGRTQKDQPSPQAKTGAARDEAGSALTRGIASGVWLREQLTGGAMALTVERVDFNDGSKAVYKKTENDDEAAREHLASLVGQAIGAKVPKVVPVDGDDRAVYMEFVEGRVAAERPNWEREWGAVQFDGAPPPPGDDARRLGLLDVLIVNNDRNTGNFFPESAPDRGDGIVGIDHGNAHFTPPRKNENGELVSEFGFGLFSAHYMKRTGRVTRFAPNELTAGDVEVLGERLAGLRSQFAALGRDHWHDAMMATFDAVAANAAGTGTGLIR
jgi:hypothetical protein